MKKDLDRLLTKLSFYSKWTAVAAIVFGVVEFMIGIAQLGIGMIAGFLFIMSGIFLFRVAEFANECKTQKDENSLVEMMDYLVRYFRLQLFTVIFVFIVIIFVTIWIIQVLSNWDWLIQFIEFAKKLGFVLEHWRNFVRPVHYLI